jgi:hypothetical protein
MAEARPVTDDWVERDIMVWRFVAFWRAVITTMSDRLRGRGSLRSAVCRLEAKVLWRLA